ncbi:MAG: hypothetical protein WKF75_14625 [Singulisphaera sp.]
MAERVVVTARRVVFHLASGYPYHGGISGGVRARDGLAAASGGWTRLGGRRRRRGFERLPRGGQRVTPRRRAGDPPRRPSMEQETLMYGPPKVG